MSKHPRSPTAEVWVSGVTRHPSKRLKWRAGFGVSEAERLEGVAAAEACLPGPGPPPMTHSEPTAPLRERMRLTRFSRPTRRTVSLQSGSSGLLAEEAGQTGILTCRPRLGRLFFILLAAESS